MCVSVHSTSNGDAELDISRMLVTLLGLKLELCCW